MAGPYYWVGGSGNWSDATNHWSTSSGGAPGVANVPTSADDVHFDANSNTTAYTVTMDVNGVCRDLMFDAAPSVSGTVTFAGVANYSVYGSLKLLAGMTYSHSAFVNASATSTGKTITTNGVVIVGSLLFNGVGGGWTLQDALTVGAMYHSTGTLDTNGKTIIAGVFSCNYSTTRSLTLGASSITIGTNVNGASWTVNATGLTFNAGTSTITLDATYFGAVAFTGAGLTYNNVVLAGNYAGGTASPFTIDSGNTFNDLTVTGHNTKTDTLTLSGNQTVSGTLTVTGNSTTNRLLVQSSALGTARTITAAVVSLSNVDFMDITGAGAAAPFTGTSLGDALGNSGITFTSSATQYWYTTTTGTKTWSTAGNWFLGSGGTGGAGRVPLPQDDVVFDASSIGAASTTVNMDMPRACKALTTTGVANSPQLSLSSAPSVYGDITLSSGVSFAASSSMGLRARSPITLTSSGVVFRISSILMPNGTLALSDAFTNSVVLTHSNGTLNDAGYAVTLASYRGQSSSVIKSGNWTLTSDAGTDGSSVWTAPSSMTDTGGTIKLTHSGSSTKVFAGGGQTYNNVWFAPGSGTGTFQVTGSNTFNQFKDDGSAAHSILFTAGTTQTIADWQVSGSAGNLITIGSITAASHTLTTGASGYREGRYLSISRSTATLANKWYAGRSGTESVDGGNNSGWIFLHAPTVVSYSATVAMAGAMIRQIAKAFTSATAMAASMLRGRFREFVASATLTASMVRSLAIVRAVTVTTSAARDLWKWTTNNAFITKFRSTVFGVGRRS